MDNNTSHPSADKNQKASPARPAAFFGVRHRGWQLALITVVVAVIAAGAYLAYDRYHLRPQRMEDEATGKAQKKRFARWQRQGRRGWDRLFAKAAGGMPGYSVDVGRPARLKLAELGPKIGPFLEEKLESDVYAERITAIQLLACIGRPSEQTQQLLTKELERATDRKQEIGVLKCATTVPNSGVVLTHLSFAALDSPHPKTRRLAIGYLFKLRNLPDAPPEIGERLVKLGTEGDLKIRLEIAVKLIQQDAPGTYRMLLEGLDSDDEETVIVAANHVARLRSGGRIDPLTATPEEKAEAIKAHRAWLEEKLEETEEAPTEQEQASKGE